MRRRSLLAQGACLLLLCLPPQTRAQQYPPEGAEGRLYTRGAFDRIKLNMPVNVRLMQGDRDAVFVEGGAHEQDRINVVVRDGRLVINQNGVLSTLWDGPQRAQIGIWVRDLSQLVMARLGEVHAPHTTRFNSLAIEISGGGQVRFDELLTERVSVNIAGAGETQLRGQATELDVQISGKGLVAADPLRARRAKVRIGGLGNVTLWATDDLNLDIAGVGTVDYWGQPELTRNGTSLARINARGDKR